MRNQKVSVVRGLDYRRNTGLEIFRKGVLDVAV